MGLVATTDTRSLYSLKSASATTDPRSKASAGWRGSWKGGGTQLPIPQISDGSFSAVSTATIATKGSFCRVFEDLQDLQTFAPLRFQKLQIFGKVCKISVKFRDVHDFH